jgi:hypothetical protein
MAFMISKETENVQSSAEIENAFRAISAQVFFQSFPVGALTFGQTTNNLNWETVLKGNLAKNGQRFQLCMWLHRRYLSFHINGGTTDFCG